MDIIDNINEYLDYIKICENLFNLCHLCAKK